MQTLSGLYVITDPELCSNSLIEKVEQAILGGAQIIQYRNKTSTAQTQFNEAQALQTLCQKYQRTFIINDDVELALKVNADGVHLGRTDGDIRLTRKAFGKDKIIGVTCHNEIDAGLSAQQQSADYVAFGRFYPSKTKPSAPPADISTLQLAKAQLCIPVVAIGGISVENAANLIEAGADMLAVIHAVFAHSNTRQAASEIAQLFNNQ